jgi:cytochrome c biogenesis protein
MIARFEKSVHDFGPGVLVAYMDEGGPKTAWFLQNVEKLREKDIQGVKVRLEEITQDFYTGLQVSKDPGVWIVWTGFAMILFGLYINFFIYFRRIYVRNVPDGAVVAGVAFKNREAFKEEFEKLKKGFSQ